jgi:hypothetical protein
VVSISLRRRFMYPKTLAALATAALAAVAPSAAQASDWHVGPTTFGAAPKSPAALVGATSQAPCQNGGITCGVVNVTAHRNGRSIKQVLIGWEATCEQPGMVMDGVAIAQGVKIKRARSGSSFKVARSYELSAGPGYTARIDDRFTGKLDKRGRSARGTYSGVAVVLRDGQQVDRCATGNVTWKALRLK